jgi:hypothetical protein
VNVERRGAGFEGCGIWGFLFDSGWVGGKTLTDAFVLFLSLFGFGGF